MPLTITIQEKEYYNEETGEFFTVPAKKIVMEHSLYAISKWESKWHKPFFGHVEKTPEEALDYIRCMALDEDVDQALFLSISKKEIDKINKYIDDPMTATTFSDDQDKKKSGKGKLGKKITTSEEIYYMMTALNIPFECDKWHFNKLQTLIRVCSIKNSPGKKMSKRAVLNKYKTLNEARRKALNTTG